MANLESHIDRILVEAGCFTAVEITLWLNNKSAVRPYTIHDIVACADKMPNVRGDGKRSCLKREAHGAR
jgi:hypothetical protein